MVDGQQAHVMIKYMKYFVKWPGNGVALDRKEPCAVTDSVSSPAYILSEWAADLEYDDLPPRVRHNCSSTQ